MADWTEPDILVFYLSYLDHQILILYISFRSFMHFNNATAVVLFWFFKTGDAVNTLL